MVWETLEKDLINRKITSVIFIAETWMAPINPNNPFMRAGESPEKKEALQAFGAKRFGPEFMITVPFERENEEIIFKSASISHNVWPAFFEPVRRKWKKKRPIKR